MSDERLAARAGRLLIEVADWLRGAHVQLDDSGEVVAFQGLSLRPTKHVLELDGRTLFGWCAADTLAIQDLVGRPAAVRSTDPVTGHAISLVVGDSGVSDVEPASAVLSMVRPPDRGDDVVPWL